MPHAEIPEGEPLMAVRTVNRQWLLARRPVGAVTTDDFRYAESDPPAPGEGEILVRTLYFAYDAGQRIRLTDDGATCRRSRSVSRCGPWASARSSRRGERRGRLRERARPAADDVQRKTARQAAPQAR